MKKRILLLYGGESTEHAISIKSALNVDAALNRDTYEVTYCYICPKGHWWLVDEISNQPPRTIELLPVMGRAALRFSNSEETRSVDIMLPILHGQNGEDGTVQGVAKMMHIPCVGPDVLAAAITMRKDVTKTLLKQADIGIAKWMGWQAHEDRPSFSLVKQTLGVPFFIKPASAGSSFGVSKVSQESEYLQALEEAASHDTVVLLEEAVEGREVEVAVLGDTDIQVTVAGEIVSEGFYTYEQKYEMFSRSKVLIPADLPPTIMDGLRQISVRAYKATQCKGMARIDSFITPEGRIVVNEINSIPGFTDTSMYPKLWEYEGVTPSQLLERLIEIAIKR